MRRSIVSVTTACLSIALAATAAQAAQAPTTLLGGASLDGGYSLASDGSGAATAMWTQDEVVDNRYVEAVIDLRQQGADGAWGNALQIGGATQTSEAQLLESSSGAAAVVWSWVETGQHARTVIDVSTRASAYRGWSQPQKVFSDANANGAEFSAGIDAAGSVTVALAPSGAGADPEILAAGISSHDTLSAPVKVIGARGGGITPILAVSSDGAAVISWQRQASAASHGSAEYAEEASYRSTTGRWGRPQELGSFGASTSGDESLVWTPTAPSSAVTADGTAVVAWRAGGAGAAVDAASVDPGTGHWNSAHTVAKDVASFGVVAGPKDSLVATWTVNDAAADQIFSATSSGTGTGAWSGSTHVALIKQGTLGLDLVANPSGTVALAPVTGSDSAIEYATRSLSGHWSAMTRAGTGAEAEVAFGPRAQPTLIWETVSPTGADSLLTNG